MKVMHVIITEKIPSGKLVRMKVDFDTRVNSIQITGDFFLHPEEGVDLLEQCVVGSPVPNEFSFFKVMFNDVIEKNNLTFIGVTADDLARLIMNAFEVKS